MAEPTGTSSTDIIAIYAAVVSTGVLLWDFFKWRRAENVRLKGRVMRDAIFADGQNPPNMEDKYICLTVDNRGHIACTVTHYFFVCYENWFQQLRGKSNFEALVNFARGHGHVVPFELRPGGSFMGVAMQTADIEEKSRTGRLYAAIQHNRADKPLRVRIKPIEVGPVVHARR